MRDKDRTMAMSHKPIVLALPAVCMMSLLACHAATNLRIANIGGLANHVSQGISELGGPNASFARFPMFRISCLPHCGNRGTASGSKYSSHNGSKDSTRISGKPPPCHFCERDTKICFGYAMYATQLPKYNYQQLPCNWRLMSH